WTSSAASSTSPGPTAVDGLRIPPYPHDVALDLVIRGGRVVTPDGGGGWDVGIAGGQIAAGGVGGRLPAGGARALAAPRVIARPGGVEPHTHLAHAIRTQPDEPGLTLGPEDDTRGMAYGGTTTHLDFCFVRPDVEMAEAIAQRQARWAGNSYVDYGFHITL